MNAKPKRFVASDNGIYYYYKRREGSIMNYPTSFIEYYKSISTEKREQKPEKQKPEEQK